MSDSNTYFQNLKTIPLFSAMEDADLEQIISAAVLQFFPPKYSIIKEGEIGDCMYIIKKGSVEVFKNSNDLGSHEKNMAVLAAGDVFGEMALVSDAPRNANIRTVDDCEIFILKKVEFDKILAQNSTLAAKVSTDVIERMKQNEKLI